jgi:hemerythrin-like metal-binding protein
MNIELLGEVIVRYKMITSNQLNEAIRIRETSGLNLGEILINLGYMTKEQLLDGARIQEYEYNKLIDNAIYKRDGKDSRNIDMEFYENNKGDLLYKTKDDWNHIRLSTGIPIIDIQHIWLVMLSHYAAKLVTTFDIKSRVDQVDTIFELLLDYAQEHFSVEEALLNFMKYNPDHIKQHKEFLTHFATEKKQYSESIIDGISSNTKTLISICEFLNGWILSHIAIHDINYAIELLKSTRKNIIVQNWIEYLKSNKLASITRIQSELYKTILEK